MVLYVVIAYFVYLISLHEVGAKPVRLTIDCGPDERNYLGLPRRSPSLRSQNDLNVESFCDLIHRAIPKAVKNGKFVLVEQDQDMSAQSDTFRPFFEPAPKNFGSIFDIDDIELPTLPPIRLPPLKLPKINAPKLKPYKSPFLKAPRIGDPMVFPKLRDVLEESSAERMEKFKKGIQRMLHVVKVLGQLDQYLSERTRIVVDKLAKTFSD